MRYKYSIRDQYFDRVCLETSVFISGFWSRGSVKLYGSDTDETTRAGLAKSAMREKLRDTGLWLKPFQIVIKLLPKAYQMHLK